MPPRLLAIALLLVAPGMPAAEGAKSGAVARAEPRTVAGKVIALDAPGRRITIATADGAVALEFDRNTNVYLPNRLGTVRDLAAGERVKASFGAERLAYWIEIEPDE